MSRALALANVLLGALAIVPALVLARTLWRDGLSTNLWVALLAILALAGGAAFLVPRRHRVLYAVNMVAAYVALYAAEIYVGVSIRPLEGSVHVSMQQWWSNAKLLLPEPGAQDRRSKRQVLDDYAAQKVDAVPGIATSLFLQRPLQTPTGLIVPLSGISRRLTVTCNEYGVWGSYVADRFGFNNPDTVWNAPLQLAVLGDSFTYGACVPEGRSFVDRIRSEIPATANLGLGGTGPLAVLGRLVEYAAQIGRAHV